MLLEIYFNQYMNFPIPEISKFGPKYYPKNLFLNNYNYSVWYEETKHQEKSSSSHQ